MGSEVMVYETMAFTALLPLVPKAVPARPSVRVIGALLFGIVVVLVRLRATGRPYTLKGLLNVFGAMLLPSLVPVLGVMALLSVSGVGEAVVVAGAVKVNVNVSLVPLGTLAVVAPNTMVTAPPTPVPKVIVPAEAWAVMASFCA